MVRKKEEIIVEQRENPMHGEGVLHIRNILNGQQEIPGADRAFTHSTLEPGGSIGFHLHEKEAETYYFLRGTGEFNDNGVLHAVSGGDITVTSSRMRAWTQEYGGEPLEFIALILTQR